MEIKELYAKGIQYKDFLESDIEEYKIEALQKWDTNLITEEFVEQCKNLEETTLLCFMELYCPDCMVLAPIFEKMHSINPAIQYRIVPRKGNETIQKSIVGENQPLRIPTIVKVQGDSVEVIYVEIPEVVKQQIVSKEKTEEEAITAYREGNFSVEIQKQLIDGFRS